ncbi:hypothetical protein PFDSM3638_08180 [Pyrococcus furiosus DSM 3638]|uniref:Uncharacterized protein n=3 Tax=Pyrococcus furiosus TaxID=2261 RepID=A0A5C0XR82_PYRFU|nr:hypothetical protein [Pyrococcus furiosus]AAL81743.1 hypothetical protein PF1619 [Pyrococcus furiosus DSM 3638]AFN05021.1 hypothetical protein PFC_10510 [Pyrococcus furiosus COM1]QEK79241.1 hypothetical protein PFDSM3638_08180 [Pyrococcus furiosus DSM 3638]
MEELVFGGKHFTVRVFTNRPVDYAFPFFGIILVDGELIAGTCKIEEGRKVLSPIDLDPYVTVQDLLDCCEFFLFDTEEQGGYMVGDIRRHARERGFPVGEKTRLFWSSLGVYMGDYTFELVNNTVNLHYYNDDIFRYNECPEFEGRYRGTISVPLKEFVEDALKLSYEYLTKYGPILDELFIKEGLSPTDEELYDALWKRHKNVKKLYREIFSGDSKSSR